MGSYKDVKQRLCFILASNPSLPKENWGVRARGYRETKPAIGRANTFVRKLDVIGEDKIRHHGLQLICGKEPPRT